MAFSSGGPYTRSLGHIPLKNEGEKTYYTPEECDIVTVPTALVAGLVSGDQREWAASHAKKIGAFAHEKDPAREMWMFAVPKPSLQRKTEMSEAADYMDKVSEIIAEM